MRRVVVIVLALIVLAPTLALAQTYRCRFDNVVREACCCPDEERASEGGGEAAAGHRHGPAIEATCCCDVVEGSAPATDERTAAPPGVQVPVPALVAAAPEMAACVAISAAAVEVETPARAPPDPLFLRHCSLLL